MMKTSDKYDFWPWPRVELFNDRPWPSGMCFRNKVQVL